VEVQTMSGWQSLGFGGVLLLFALGQIAVAVRLLGPQRQFFLRQPRRISSAAAFGAISQRGNEGLLAAVLLVCGGFALAAAPITLLVSVFILLTD
jgi:hypothetical protein